MIKRIIEFFRRLYIKWFCDVAVDLSNGKEYGAKVYYRISREGKVTIHDIEILPRDIIVSRANGKTTIAIRQQLKVVYPRIYHLANRANKQRVRKKNINRLEKVLQEAMND